MSQNPASPFISASMLQPLTSSPITLLDVRWKLGQTDSVEQFEAAHIPGAQYVDLNTELAGPARNGLGRHPLPEQQAFAESVRRWGIRQGVPVIVYDDNFGMSAARLWWLLRDAGVYNVHILDGGLAAWRESGGEVIAGSTQAQTKLSERAEQADVEITFGRLPSITIDQAAQWPEHGVLLDARAAERYRGEVEPIDPRAGHVPGAKSSPTGELLDDSGLVLSPATLRERFGPLNGDIAVYCGSGVTAAHHIAVLAHAGLEAALFPGSWSQWSADPARPVEAGASNTQ